METGNGHGRKRRAWRVIEPQIPAIHRLVDDGEEAGLIHPNAAKGLRRALNRLEDDYGGLVDQLDRMIRLADWQGPLEAA